MNFKPITRKKKTEFLIKIINKNPLTQDNFKMTYVYAVFFVKFKRAVDETRITDPGYTYRFDTQDEANEWLKKDGREISARYMKNYGKWTEYCMYTTIEE